MSPEQIEIALERILPRVTKPGRYTGGEYNQIVKNWDEVEFKAALAFPDIYDLGMSNLGLMILYDIINKHRIDHLEVAPVANTSMKMSMMGVKDPNLGIPNLLGVLPGMTAFATKLMRDKMEELEVPPVREYLQMLVDAGAKLYACKMTVDMNNLSKDDFVDGVIDVVTAADFIDMTDGAQVIFI